VLRKVGHSGGHDVVEVTFEGAARLQPLCDAGGDPLPRGSWEVLVQCGALGFVRSARVGSSHLLDAGLAAAEVGADRTPVVPYLREPRHTLTLDVGSRHADLPQPRRPASAKARTATWVLRRLPPRARLRAVAVAEARLRARRR
jgi:hypothetical protein